MALPRLEHEHERLITALELRESCHSWEGVQETTENCTVQRFDEHDAHVIRAVVLATALVQGFDVVAVFGGAEDLLWHSDATVVRDHGPELSKLVVVDDDTFDGLSGQVINHTLQLRDPVSAPSIYYLVLLFLESVLLGAANIDFKGILDQQVYVSLVLANFDVERQHSACVCLCLQEPLVVFED